MTLRTIAKCTKIFKKSASPAFQNIQIGDKMQKICSKIKNHSEVKWETN